jgi:hypothetical protein
MSPRVQLGTWPLGLALTTSQFFGCGGKWFLLLLPYLNNRQMTPRGYPNFHSYMKILRVLVFQMDREINPVWVCKPSLK